MARKAVKDAAAKDSSARKGRTTTTSKIKTEAVTKAKPFNIPLERLTLPDVIKAVQLAEGNFDCFGSATVYCDQDACSWRVACFTTVGQDF